MLASESRRLVDSRLSTSAVVNDEEEAQVFPSDSLDRNRSGLKLCRFNGLQLSGVFVDKLHHRNIFLPLSCVCSAD